jgi:hypothetical protein
MASLNRIIETLPLQMIEQVPLLALPLLGLHPLAILLMVSPLFCFLHSLLLG